MVHTNSKVSSFAHKGFLVDVTVATENSLLDTECGMIPVHKGDYILESRNGKQQVLTEGVFKKHYVPVEEVVERKRVKTAKSPFEEQYERAFMSFALQSNEEDREYIAKFQNDIKHKIK